MARLSDEAIRGELTNLAGWTYADAALRRTYTFPSFMRGIGFVNEVAELAEDANHHPDISINYTRISLSLSTHDAGGVTEKDIALARRIQALADL
jgi:4a-hydroxytetrahydrobiopterin dehydratase